MASSTTSGEEILVLYGSQTGNSEGAAEEITALIPTKLTTSSSSSSPCTARCMHLDDFLELENAKWTRLVVIVCSSYGVGQAPIGARKFRDVCDAILDQRNNDNGGSGGENNDNNDKSSKGMFLEGVTFALLGLGDSHYSTFFKNPTAIHEALTAVGATRVGELGKADASGTDIMEQSKVIDRWIQSIWDDLAKVVATAPPEQVVLDRACEGTWGLCLESFPEWKKKPTKFYVALVTLLCVPLGGIIFSILVHYFLDRKSLDQTF
ncbi:hypothetical protein ACHAXR_008345 [Thalassiosira sp. AJA248-18]